MPTLIAINRHNLQEIPVDVVVSVVLEDCRRPGHCLKAATSLNSSTNKNVSVEKMMNCHKLINFVSRTLAI